MNIIDDIDWFKVIELHSKNGLRGHIMAALGTHGHMKVRMNGKIASDDVICMSLYKRVFPRWNYQPISYFYQPKQQQDRLICNNSSKGNEIMNFMDED